MCLVSLVHRLPFSWNVCLFVSSTLLQLVSFMPKTRVMIIDIDLVTWMATSSDFCFS